MRRYEWTRIAVLVMLVASVWVSSIQGRAALVQMQRHGCERGKADRQANALGWRTAEIARTATARDLSAPQLERRGARTAAGVYDRIASELERRSRIDCARVYPDPGPFALDGK